MADGGLTVSVPREDNNEEADGNTGLSLGNNFEEEEEEDDSNIRNQAGLNSPKGDPTLGIPNDEVDGGSTPNTLRNQYDVNSPRKKGEIPGGWGAANEAEKGGDVPSALAGLVTQVARDDDNTMMATSQGESTNKKLDEDSNYSTEQDIRNETESKGFCSCFAAIFSCCSNSSQAGSVRNGNVNGNGSKSKSNDPLIPQGGISKKGVSVGSKSADTDGMNSNSNSTSNSKGNNANGQDTDKTNNNNNNNNSNNNSNNNTNNNKNENEKEESYTETEYPPGLLPPLLPEHIGKKCLVLDLDETLVHSSFKPIPNPDFIIPVEIDNVVHRVYVMKRPYVDEFLIETAKDYEIVVFTASLAKYADPLLDKLDTHKTITHRLFRESCVLHGTAYVKDLRTLGRKLRDSIIVDNSPPSYLFQPINAIPILSWFDDQTDTQLRDVLPCLQTTLKNIKDVRNILDANTKSFRWLCQQANKPLSLYE